MIYDLTYNCGPVARDFHADISSRVKLLIGPFGCLDKYTEYLSKRGWISFDEWQDGDIVAEYNIGTDKIEWRKPKNYVKLPCKEFFHLFNSRVDQMLSPEHTVLYDLKNKPGDWKTIKAFDLYQSHQELKGGFDGRFPTTFGAGNTNGINLSDDELRLMVAISADGCFAVGAAERKCIITLRKQRKIERLRGLLSRCDIRWDEFVSPTRPAEFRLCFFAPEENKDLWKYIEATPEQLVIIHDEWPHWDGCVDNYGGKIFSTTVATNADFIQYVCATQNCRATINRVKYTKPHQTNWKDVYRLYANQRNQMTTIRGSKINIKPSVDGYKYCFESSTGFFVARRNGRVFITGNTGKTSSSAFDLIEMASKRVLPVMGKRRSRFAVVRNTYPELRDTTIKSYFDWFPTNIFGNYNQTDKIYKISYEDREIEIIFKALDNPKDVRDLLSLELTGAHVDEAREIHADVVKGLLGRVGRYPSMKSTQGKNPFLSPPQVILSTNYPSTQHWLYKDFVSNPVEGYTIYEQGQEENKHNLRPGYYEDLAKDYADRPDLLKTLVQGTWGITVAGKPVYPEFKRSLHVSKAPLKPVGPCEIIRGWDNTGLSPAIILTYVGPTGQWNLFKEFTWEDATGIMDATEEMVVWCNMNLHAKCTFKDIGDPAGSQGRDSVKKTPAQYIQEKAKEYGKTINIIKGIQTFKVRRESVAERLSKLINGEPALLIDHSCTMTIDGFDGGYAYPEIGNSGVFRTEPAKNEYSHIHDAIQYPATIMFKARQNKPVKSVSDIMASRNFRGAW
jgi:hypothetical protein